jgi:hypothetical protein
MASGPQIMLSAPVYCAHSESLPVSCRFFPRATAQPPPGRRLWRFPCGRPSKSSSEVKTVSGSFTGIRPVIVRLTGTTPLLRQYFPKGTDLSIHSPVRLLEVTTELNNRPRKTLGGITPAQAMQRLLSNSEKPIVATTA